VNAPVELIDAFGLTSVWTYLALFVVASLLMIWRLEALLKHGLEGTALGTLVMPYCSGLGNLLFVGIVVAGRAPAEEILTNCLVNNVTNLTLVLAFPVLAWGLSLRGKAGAAKPRGRKNVRRENPDTAQQLSRLSLLLSLAAVVFFTAVTWVLANDGKLDRGDGLVLIGLFLFWQCFQVFDVMKHNVRQQRSFGGGFYVDLLFVLIGAWALYVSIDWLVTWLSAQQSGFISAENLGWLSGWLMVLPNALLAVYYAARGRADVAYASQVGDGHICIPLCLGLGVALVPVAVPAFFLTGLVVLGAVAVGHLLCVAVTGGLPKWSGWVLIAVYTWFLAAGLR
jgi:cation:H+ antiporter